MKSLANLTDIRLFSGMYSQVCNQIKLHMKRFLTKLTLVFPLCEIIKSFSAIKLRAVVFSIEYNLLLHVDTISQLSVNKAAHLCQIYLSNFS